MTVGENNTTYQICPQCGQQNRSSFHCCHHCGFVFPKASKKLRLPTARAGMIGGAALGLAFGLLLWERN
jgi:ribosomal protein L37E